MDLPETTSAVVGTVWNYQKSRKLLVRAEMAYQRHAFERLAFVRGPVVVSASDLQMDKIFSAGLKIHYGLFKIGYTFGQNTSNSFGYSYNQHGFDGLFSQGLGQGFDFHAFATVQARAYASTDGLPNLLVGEYAQALGLLKLAHPLWRDYTISAQIEWSRNGARQGGIFYKKRIFSVSLESIL